MISERIRALFAVGAAIAAADGKAAALVTGEEGIEARPALAVGAAGVALATSAAVADASGGDSNIAFAS